MKNPGMIILLVVLAASSSLAVAANTGASRSSNILRLQASAPSSRQAATEKITLVLTDRDARDIRGRLASAGVSVQRQHGNRYQVRVSRQQLKPLLDQLPDSVYARLPFPHTQNAVTSQGVDIIGATDMHNLNFGGSGMKVGIIDLGFGSLSSAQASGDLPLSLQLTDYTGTGSGGTNHGTQVAEIVHDVAPAAELYLAKVETVLDMEAAVNDMIAAGVSVINHSVGWFGAAFYDGSGPLCDVTNTAYNSGLAR